MNGLALLSIVLMGFGFFVCLKKETKQEVRNDCFLFLFTQSVGSMHCSESLKQTITGRYADVY